MDEISKFRLTGAAIWLLLLIIVVPSWYSNPVNFNPDSELGAEIKSTEPVVYQQYVLPVKDKPVADVQPQVSHPDKKQSHQQPEVVLPKVESQEPGVVEKKAVIKPAVKQAANRAIKPSTALGNPEPKTGEWLLMIYGSKDIKAANRVLGLLDDKYEVWIKEFPKSNSFSVRTGPYKSRAAAERDKTKIDKAIRTHSQIVQVK